MNEKRHEEFRRVHDDSSWQETALERAVNAYIDKVSRGDYYLEKGTLAEVTEYARGELQRLIDDRPYLPEEEPNADDVHDMSIALFVIHMPSFLPENVCAVLKEEMDSSSAKIGEFRRLSWNEEGRRTKPRSKERKDYNDRLNEATKQMHQEQDQRLRAILHQAGIDLLDLEYAQRIHSMRYGRRCIMRNLCDSMHIRAGTDLTEAAKNIPKDDGVFEGGRGTNRLRQFADDGGELHAINKAARDASGVPREDEERLDIDDQTFFVPEKRIVDPEERE